jgi:hypothetical protein
MPPASANNLAAMSIQTTREVIPMQGMPDELSAILKYSNEENLVSRGRSTRDPVFQTLHTILRDMLGALNYRVKYREHLMSWSWDGSIPAINDHMPINVDRPGEQGGSIERQVPKHLVYLVSTLYEDCNETTIGYHIVFEGYRAIRKWMDDTSPSGYGTLALERAVKKHAKTAHATYLMTHFAYRRPEMTVGKCTKLCAWMELLFAYSKHEREEILEEMLSQQFRKALDPRLFISTSGQVDNADGDTLF